MSTDYVDLAEAACCMWEWLHPRQNMPTYPMIGWAFAVHGNVGMRMWCVENAATMDAIWKAASAVIDPPFDWEFVPYVLNNHVDWNVREFKGSVEEIAQRCRQHFDVYDFAE